MSELAKTYEPAAVEAKWYDFWLQSSCFTADPARVSEQRPAYSIVIPPPNVTGILHLGHILNNTIQDILARRARMLGKEVLWLPGTDHAGIATQNVVEKALKKEGAIKHRNDLGREGLVAKIWEWREKYGGTILQQLRALGCSLDWSRTRFTMDEPYSRCVARVFVDLYKKGLIYRGKRMVNWCPASLTALSDEEVVMKEQNGALYYFKVEVAATSSSQVVPAASSPQFLTIATTRPETIPGDTAIAVNPKDPRYAHLIGHQVRRPLPPENQALIPIVGDDAVAFDFGTGVLKVTPAHDKADYEIGQRHNLPLVDIMHPNGTMNALAGRALDGLDRFEARKRALELLRENGALEKEEPYKNNVGYSERADVPIEPRLSEQWFLKYPNVLQAKVSVEQTEILNKKPVVITVSGQEFSGRNIRELRKAALIYARERGFLGTAFKNEDSGRHIRAGRESLSHSFSHLGVANILAVAALPELIRTAIWISSAPHEPASPQFVRVHRYIAAVSIRGELHSAYITAKEARDGTIYYDHRVQKVAFGGKSLEAHLPEEKLDTQPAPNATALTVRELIAGVNESLIGGLKFYPPRWAKVYEHWMTNIQDWCISRQLWWGHRIPVWSKTYDHYDLGCVYSDISDLLTPPPTNDFRYIGNDSPDVAMVIEGKHATSDSKRLLELALEIPKTDNEVREITAHISTVDLALVERMEEQGWQQDPDVLDTWFSSWLWPFATMGWPEKTDTLAKFYPTTDLVTGPDIIFFWVARMIMAGFEWMGEMPFRNVYFTGIIRDKQGRKMSKSLGNSPDPLDLIAKYGADALRFGVMRSAPLGADVMYDEKNVELGRNFCTKLWNAVRFRQMQGGSAEGEIVPALLTSDDQWILFRLDAAIREISSALDEYRFSDATQALYRFFWSEYCDWYLEAVKAALNGPDPARKANALAVIDFVLGHTLRLMHPFLPFITEELWQSLGFHEDLPAEQGGRTIMTAPWPAPLEEDFRAHYGLRESDEQFANAKYEVVIQGRALRRDCNIASNKRVRFILRPNAPLPAHERDVLQLLLNADPLDCDVAAPNGTPSALTPLGQLFLPLEGLIDATAERERLTKEIAKVADELAKVRAKLANPSFAEKVPPAVLEEHRQREHSWSEKLAQLERLRAALAA